MVESGGRMAIAVKMLTAAVKRRDDGNTSTVRRACRVRKLSSRRQRVLMDDTTETIPAHNTRVAGCRRGYNDGPWLRWRQRQRSMWPVPIVVIDKHLKNPLEVR